MEKVTRCKFKCDSILLLENGHKNVTLLPVMSGSEENKSFWKQSPGGKFELYYVNPEVEFIPGKEYYIDISLAAAPVQAV